MKTKNDFSLSDVNTLHLLFIQESKYFLSKFHGFLFIGDSFCWCSIRTKIDRKIFISFK